MMLLRRELGDVLRETRQGQGRTLREVSAEAACSLGYLSEIERGEKEASSELLASICRALDLPLSQMLSDVADRLNLAEAAETQMTAVLNEGLARPLRHGQVRVRRDQVVSAA
ncbi:MULTISPECIES: helix-turn-helix domain-containing protein [unclassified Ornithinimicrobium]|uniref:helix-turn-helix domain-containing protein n=1 Tax=unclassified Ornithinimicrobium TaxID=2615080 RepID=UPI003853CE85